MKLPPMKDLKSTNLEAMGHEGDCLYIRFANATYRYDGVPKRVYDAGLEAKSPGAWFREEVLGKYGFERLDAKP